MRVRLPDFAGACSSATDPLPLLHSMPSTDELLLNPDCADPSSLRGLPDADTMIDTPSLPGVTSPSTLLPPCWTTAFPNTSTDMFNGAKAAAPAPPPPPIEPDSPMVPPLVLIVLTVLDVLVVLPLLDVLALRRMLGCGALLLRMRTRKCPCSSWLLASSNGSLPALLLRLSTIANSLSVRLRCHITILLASLSPSQAAASDVSASVAGGVSTSEGGCDAITATFCRVSGCAATESAPDEAAAALLVSSLRVGDAQIGGSACVSVPRLGDAGTVGRPPGVLGPLDGALATAATGGGTCRSRLEVCALAIKPLCGDMFTRERNAAYALLSESPSPGCAFVGCPPCPCPVGLDHAGCESGDSVVASVLKAPSNRGLGRHCPPAYCTRPVRLPQLNGTATASESVRGTAMDRGTLSTRDCVAFRGACDGTLDAAAFDESCDGGATKGVTSFVVTGDCPCD
eukprot:Opistho-2@25116